MSLMKQEDWRPQGVDLLEPRAWEALREVDRSVLVTAGAGAGKTEFLAQKAAYLLQTGICPAPHRILAISFKKDAARNLAERVSLRCSPEQARRFDSKTFDAFTKSMVDRFRKSIPDPWMPPMDYRIVMPKKINVENFLNRNGMQYIEVKQFESALASENLPFHHGSTPAVVAYWRESYHDRGEVGLSFSMINRLVVWLLRENPNIKSALQMTYPYIFLDEFQDTTHAQFDLLNAVFEDSQAKLTAVGDDKQRIMVWAGALLDAFHQFHHVYSAKRVSLLSNWRSHQELVAIQHVVAQRLNPIVEFPEARGKKRIEGDIAAIWDFPSAQTESENLARWIMAEVKAGTVEPHNVAVLVRFHANRVEAELLSAFSAQGLTLRNLDRKLGEISIQDILNEDLTGLLLPLLRLGTLSKSPLNWDLCQRNLNIVSGKDPSDHVAHQRDQRNLDERVQSLRSQMRDQEPTPTTARAMAVAARDLWTMELIRQAFPAYRQLQDFDRAWNGFTALFEECADKRENWSEVLDEFEGMGQVPIMTIHKSKGLEFHTMIFYGLEGDTWWSLEPNNREELSVFFVALSRAEQRAFFTLCRERGDGIEWLEQLLGLAGVLRRDGTTLV